MSRFSLLKENIGLNQDMMKTIQQHTLFCICCLERNVPFINLLSCTHTEFLNNFEQPEIKPLNPVVCLHCHIMLTKIQRFKLQVEESFKLLKKKANNTESSNERQNNLKLRKIICISVIPDCDPKRNQLTNLEKENSFENIIKENNFEIITCKTENIRKDNDSENITCKSENNFENVREENLGCRIYYEENIICKTENITNENNFVNKIFYEENIEKESNNYKYTDTTPAAVNYNNVENTENDLQTDAETYYNKKLKNIETALSIINKNKSDDFINVLGTSINNIVANNLTNILQGTNIPNVFGLVTKATDGVKVEDQISVLDDVESQDVASKNYTLDHMEINTITLTKEELKAERNLIAKSEAYVTSPHQCKWCLVGFQFKDNFDDHMKRRHADKKGGVTCSICLQVLPEFSYEEHRTRHYTRYRCGLCDIQFALYDEAVEHYETEHTNTVRTRQQCDYSKCDVYKSTENCVGTSHTVTNTETRKRSSQVAESPPEKKTIRK